MLAWLARWRRRREDARWRRIEEEAARKTARLGEDFAKRRAVMAQIGPHPLSGGAVGGSTAPDAPRERPTLSPVLARPEPVCEPRDHATALANELRDQRSMR